MTARQGRLLGVGVDLVEMERAGRFVHAHPGGVERFLLPSENLLFKKARNKPLAFALIFAAKEAASKSVGQSLGGPGAFRAFRVSRSGRRLTVRWTAPAGRNVAFRLLPFRWKNLAGMLVWSYGGTSSRLVK
jgi:holo-[acyl-carrier-protein] synthase